MMLHWRHLGHCKHVPFTTEGWVTVSKVQKKYGWTHVDLPNAVHSLDNKLALVDIQFWGFLMRMMPKVEYGNEKNFRFVRGLKRHYYEDPHWVTNAVEDYNLPIHEMPLETAVIKRFREDNLMIPNEFKGRTLNQFIRLVYWLLTNGYSRAINGIARNFFSNYHNDPVSWGKPNFGPITTTTPAALFDPDHPNSVMRGSIFSVWP